MATSTLVRSIKVASRMDVALCSMIMARCMKAIGVLVKHKDVAFTSTSMAMHIMESGNKIYATASVGRTWLMAHDTKVSGGRVAGTVKAQTLCKMVLFTLECT